MFAKLSAVILAAGVCACGLLALRQQRLQAAHELTQAQLRIRQQDEKLWDLRTRIAMEVTPQKVEKLASAFGTLRPMIAPPRSVPEQKLADAALPAGTPKLKVPANRPGAPR